MLNDYFWVRKTHYDIKTGGEPILEVVKGETFTYRHCSFGVYFDEDNNLWRLIDLNTGLQYAESPSRIRVLSRLWVGPLFGAYMDKRWSHHYMELCDFLLSETIYQRNLAIKNHALKLSEAEKKSFLSRPQESRYFPWSRLSGKELDKAIYEETRLKADRGRYS